MLLTIYFNHYVLLYILKTINNMSELNATIFANWKEFINAETEKIVNENL